MTSCRHQRSARLRPFGGVLLWVAVAVGGCKARPPETSDTTNATPAVAPAPDTLWQPVLVTFRRDSIAWPGGAPPDTIRAKLDRAVERLRASAEFDVLASSPALLVVRVRSKVAGGASTLAATLAAHPLVEATRVEDTGQRR